MKLFLKMKNSLDFLGFKIRGAASEEEGQIVMTLSRLPKPHLQVVKQFLIVSLAEWESHIDWLRKLAGHTGGPSQAIVLIRESCKGDLVYNAVHEIGHLVWHYYLREGEKQEFNGIAELVRGDELVAITLYAEIEGFNEHFAEAYAHYVLKPHFLRRKEPKVYQWQKNYVFHGENYLFLEEKLKDSES